MNGIPHFPHLRFAAAVTHMWKNVDWRVRDEIDIFANVRQCILYSAGIKGFEKI